MNNPGRVERFRLKLVKLATMPLLVYYKSLKNI